MKISTKTNITVQLTLTEEEAGYLKAVAARIGGNPRGPRGVFDAMLEALERAGVQVPVRLGIDGSISMDDGR